MAAFFDGLMQGVNATCISVLGDPITYTPSVTGSTTFTIKAIPGDPPDLDDAPAGVCILLSFNSTDFPQPPLRGDQVTMATGQTYIVENVESDFEGMTILTCFKNKTPDD